VGPQSATEQALEAVYCDDGAGSVGISDAGSVHLSISLQDAKRVADDVGGNGCCELDYDETKELQR